MSGIFYGQDSCDKISNQASVNEKWLHREERERKRDRDREREGERRRERDRERVQYNKWEDSWIFFRNEHLNYYIKYQYHISKTFECRKWKKSNKFVVNVR